MRNRAGKNRADDRMIHHGQRRATGLATTDRQRVGPDSESCDEPREAVIPVVPMERAGDVGAVQYDPRLVEWHSVGHLYSDEHVAAAHEVGPSGDGDDVESAARRLRRRPGRKRQDEYDADDDRCARAADTHVHHPSFDSA